MIKRPASLIELENHLQEILSPSGGLSGACWVSKLLDLMTFASSQEEKALLIKVLLNTNPAEKATFSRFLQLGGVEILGKWIEEIKFLDDQDSKQLIQNILSSLNKLNIPKDALQKTNIGNILNSLKTIPDTSIQAKASSMLSRWEKMNSEEEFVIKQVKDPKIEMNKKWAIQDELEVVKLFWRSDEPNAQCASLRPLPDTLESAISVTSVEDFRKKESQMEKELNRKVKKIQEKIKEDSIKYVLENMTPKVLYSNLMSDFYTEINKRGSFRPKKVESIENMEESKRQQGSFRVSYQRESDIPRVPCDDFKYSSADLVFIPSQRIIAPPKVDLQGQVPLMVPLNQGIIPGSVMDPNYLNLMMMSQNQAMPMYFPPNVKMLLNNSNTKPINYRTEACKNFHSAAGCTHGDACHFIHDFAFEGRPIPNMAEWRRNNEIRNKNIESMKNMQIGYPSYYPPASEPHLR